MTTQIIEALEAAIVILNEEYARSCPNTAGSMKIKLELEVGGVWGRIVRAEYWKGQEKANARSAFGFIKMEDNTIWKAAGWKAPAKNKHRGVLADLHDANKIKRCWVYGIQ